MSRPSVASRSVAPLVTAAVVLLGAAAVAAAVPSTTPTPVPETVAPLALATWAPGSPAPPPVASATWLVADLGTGEILGEQGGHIPLPPASTLKVLTALALLPQLDKARTYTATAADAGIEGSKVGLFEGGVYTVDQLFQALLLQSGNDAAHALGELGGGQAATAVRMNAVAEALGATDTRAVGTSGLDEPGQVSTAFDLAVLARAALARPDFAAYVTTRRVEFPGRDGSTYEVANQNQLLDRYPGATGVKTGFTTQAGRTFVGAAERSGRRLVVSVMNTKSASWEVAAALLDWGFAVEAQAGRRTGTLGALSARPTAAPTTAAPTRTTAAHPATAPASARATAAAVGDDGWPGWAWAAVPAGALVAAALGGLGAFRRRRAPSA